MFDIGRYEFEGDGAKGHVTAPHRGTHRHGT
jgi:hypothetical protein